jgi:MFS family permease
MTTSTRIALLRPLAERDFALLWTGRAASLLGDGVYMVALAWQVYELSNAPAALAIVGVALSIPQVLLLLLGGVLSDRLERRRLLIAADLLRGAAVGAMGLLAVTGAIELWHVIALVTLVGAGDALFQPAFTGIVPELLPRERLVEANALEQFLRPMAIRLVGPGLGGLAVAAAGAGDALLFDAATFAVSAAALAAMRARPARRSAAGHASAWASLREGIAFARGERWLWCTLIAAAVSLLAFWGPFEVLLPWVVKNRLGGSAADFGVVLAAGGLGAMAASLRLSQRGLPRRRFTSMYVAWTAMTLSLAGYGLATATWQAAAIYAGAFACNAVVMVTWTTLVQTLVPAELMGRIASLDWAVSFAPIPLSFALTGPIAAAVGPQATLIGAGLLGAGSTLAVFALGRLGRLDEAPAAAAPAPAAAVTA